MDLLGWVIVAGAVLVVVAVAVAAVLLRRARHVADERVMAAAREAAAREAAGREGKRLSPGMTQGPPTATGDGRAWVSAPPAQPRRTRAGAVGRPTGGSRARRDDEHRLREPMVVRDGDGGTHYVDDDGTLYHQDADDGPPVVESADGSTFDVVETDPRGRGGELQPGATDLFVPTVEPSRSDGWGAAADPHGGGGSAPDAGSSGGSDSGGGSGGGGD